MDKKKVYKPIEKFDSVTIPDKSEQDGTATQYVLDRFKYLYSLKSHRYLKYWQFRNEYSQLEVVDNTEDGFIKYSMNT